MESGTGIARRLRDADLKEAGASKAAATRPLTGADMLELREAMSRHCGVVREAGGLTALLSLIERLEAGHPGAPQVTAARLIASGALARTESRGGHFRSDFPDTGAPERQFLFHTSREALVV